MVPDGQKSEQTEWTDGRRQNYISPTSSGDNKNVVQQKGQHITYILTRPCMIFLGFSEVKNAFLSLHAR